MRWTISNGICTASVDDVQIRLDATPTVAAAGADQTGATAICGTSTTLTGNTPVTGTGLWTVVSGAGGSFVSATNGGSVFNGVAGTTYTLQWTISNGVCASSPDQVDISFLKTPTVSNAGPDQNFCGAGVTLAGNSPAAGTGAWSFAPSNVGVGGSFGNAALFNSGFTGTAGQTYILRWTITNGICTASVDDVQIRLDATPSIADAGVPSITQCNSSTFVMNAVVPSPGNGTWTVQIGVATITNNISATTTITGVAPGTSATLRWTVGNGTCPTTFDDIVLTNSAPTPAANANVDQVQCNNSTFTLAGNAPAPGTGVWTIQSGPGSVTTPGSPTSTVTGVTAGGPPTVVRWTISNGACSSFDDVTLTNNVDPFVTTPSNQILCANTSTSAVTFSGNASNYNWTNDTPSIGLPASGTGDIAPFTALNSTGSPVTATIAITPTSGICAGTQQSFTIKVNPVPVISPIPNVATGTGVVVGPIAVTTSAGGGEAISWSGGAAVGLADGSSGTSPIPAFTTTNAGVTPLIATVSVVALKNGCSGPAQTFSVTVYPVPGALAGDQDICSGGFTGVLITATVVGTTFSWTIGTVTGTVTGQAPGNGTVIAQQLISAAGGVVEYIITPTAYGIPGPPSSVFVSVQPTPVGNPVTAGTYTICSGSSLNITPTTNVPSSTFTWTGDNGSGGSGNITDAPVNASNNPSNVTYTVIPKGPSPTFCVGAPFTIVVTVNPNPSFTTTNNAPIICSGSNTNILFSSSTAGHRINVKSISYNGAGHSGTIVPGTTIFTNGNTLSEALTNSTNLPIDVVYTFNVTTPGSVPVCPLVVVDQSVTVRVNPIPDASSGNQRICSGSTTNISITNPNNVNGTTFSWTVGTVSGVSGAIAGSGTVINQNLTSASGGTVDYVITPSANGCPGLALPPITVTVDPLPVGNSVAAGTYKVCSGTALNILPTLSVGSGTFSWSGSNGSGGTGNITDAPVNATNSPINITYTIIPTGPSPTFCVGAGFPIVVTVNPNPNFTVTNNSATICSGSSTNLLFNSATTGHQINVVSVNYNGAGNSGTITPGTTFVNGNSLVEMLTNTTNAPINVVYEFDITTPSTTPVCPVALTSQFITVRVNPAPTFSINNTASPICSGSSTNITLNTLTTNGLVTLTTVNYNGATGGTQINGNTFTNGQKIIEPLINPGTTPIIVTYTFSVSANGCNNPTTQSSSVTVKPSPVITTSAALLETTICSGVTLNFTPSSTIGTTTYAWVSAISGPIVPASVTVSGNNAITDSPVNNGNVAGTVTYTITPTAGTCQGAPVNYVVTVNPVPTASASIQTICSGASSSVGITAAPTNVASTTYTWIVFSSSNVTGAAAGSGSTIGQVLTSTDGITSGTVTYRITPSANGCNGPTTDVTVNVTAVAVITTAAAQLQTTICSGSALSFTPTSSIGATTYSWTSTISGPISGASVTTGPSGVIPIANAPINTGNVAGTVTYHITPFNGVCAGLPKDYVVTVEPVPTANGTNITICSGQNAVVAIDATPQNVSGTTFSWIVIPTGNVTGAAGGNGSTISQTLSLTNYSFGSVIYRITPLANGCTGPTKDITVAVDPIALVNAGVDYAVCEPATILLTGSIGGAAGSGTWSIVTGGGSISSSSSERHNRNGHLHCGSG